MDIGTGYREIAPPPALAHAVSALWIRAVPDGIASLVDVWPDAGIDIMWQRGADPLLAGPDTGPMPAELPPGAVLIGARFRPGAAGPALAMPMHEIRDQRVALADVRSDLARRLRGDLDPDEALGRLIDAITVSVAQGEPDAVVSNVARYLERPATPLDPLLDASSLGHRQLRRRFQNALGYGPKMLQRITRFQWAVRHLTARPSVSLAALAVEGRYSDQAHMTREFRRLSGRTPAELRAELATETFKTASV